MGPDEKNVLAGFDELTISRGRARVRDGAVTNLVEGERGVTALVRGSRRSPYGVHLPRDRNTGKIAPASAWCTCPMAAMCKHIVAVVIVYFDNEFWEQFDTFDTEEEQDEGPVAPDRLLPEPGRGIRQRGRERFEPAGPDATAAAKLPQRAGRLSRDSLLEALSSALAPAAVPPDTVLPVDEADIPHGHSAVKEIFDPRRPRKKAPSERWRLAFTISGQPQTEMRYQQVYGTRDARPHACICPALQYIRKDGPLGRLDKYRPDVEREPADPASEALLGRLALDGGEAPLLLHWDFILDNPQLPLYPAGPDGRGRYDHPLQHARIVRIRIDFRLDEEAAYLPGGPHVRPVVRAELERDGDLSAAEAVPQPTASPEPQEAVWVDAWEGTLVALAGQRLGWCQGDERLLALVRYLWAYKPLLDRGHLAELKQKVEAAANPLVAVDFPYRRMRLASRPPQADLLLRERGDGIQAELTFRYPARGEIPEAAADEWVLLRRDQAWEGRINAALQQVFLRGHRRVRADYSPWDVGPNWTFRTGMAQFLEAFGADLLARGIGLSIGDLSHRLARTGERLQVRVSSGIDWFDLAVSAGEDIDLSGIDPNDPLFSHGFVRNGTRIIYIGTEEAEKLRKIIGLLDPSQKSPRVSRRDLEAAAFLRELVPEPPLELARAAEISRALAAPGSFANAGPPRGFQGTLRDYQRAGLGWLQFLADQGLNGCLADDMGLGKTVQALALLQGMKEMAAGDDTTGGSKRRAGGTVGADAGQDREGPSLVVAPVSTLRNWEAEAARFTPGLRVHVHHGIDRPRDANAFREADLVIVSYATLRNDQELFQQQEWNVLILDEAQTIKNPGTQSFAAVKTLEGRHRFTLTGTPLENSVIDLWAQLDFLEPGLLGSMQRFKKKFGSRGADSPDPERERLRRIVRPFILRRTKDVVERSLPPKEEVRLLAEMGTRQKAAYDALKEGYRKRIAAALRDKGIAASGALIFEGLLRLRQAACIPEHASPSLKGTPAAKLELLEEVLDEIMSERHRVLVFSQFVKTLAVIASMLDHRQVPYAYLDGSTKNRQQVIDRFQGDPGVPLFLLSLKAGGLGINLTAADYVVIFDPWWNPAVERQAVDRSHRIGQQKPVFVYRLITKESIEERILTLQDRKRALAAELIEENPTSLLALGEEELMGLFQ